MATNGTGRLRGGGRKLALAQRPVNNSGQKLSIEQRSQVLDWLARGWTPTRVVSALQFYGGPAVTGQAIQGYAKRHAAEIRQKRDRWIAELRGDPLTVIRDRVRELTKMYGVGVLAQYRELCPKCGGEGTLPVMRQPTDEKGKPVKTVEPVLERTRCEQCLGRKWIVPATVQELIRKAGGDVRFETLLEAPPAADPEGLDACRSILRQIREEVGDAWSPREQSTKPDGGLVAGDVNMVVISGSKEEYIAKLRQLRGEPVPLPTGAPAAPSAAGGNGGPPIQP